MAQLIELGEYQARCLPSASPTAADRALVLCR